MKVLDGHLDAGEGSLGIHVDVSHSAATVPDQTVTVEAECVEIRGRRVKFKVSAHDGLDLISDGTHERMIVPWDKFEAKVNQKAKAARVGPVLRRKA